MKSQKKRNSLTLNSSPEYTSFVFKKNDDIDYFKQFFPRHTSFSGKYSRQWLVRESRVDGMVTVTRQRSNGELEHKRYAHDGYRGWVKASGKTEDGQFHYKRFFEQCRANKASFEPLGLQDVNKTDLGEALIDLLEKEGFNLTNQIFPPAKEVSLNQLYAHKLDDYSQTDSGSSEEDPHQNFQMWLNNLA